MKSSVLCCIFSSIFLVDFVYSAVHLSAVYQDGLPIVTFSVGKQIVISCNATSDEKNAKIDVEWKQNDVLIEDVDSLKDRYRTSKRGTIYKLEIRDAREEDIAKYTCALEDDKNSQGVDIEVFTKPSVKVQRSINTVELEVLKIKCIVSGKPPSEISWFYSNETMNETNVNDIGDDRITFEKDTEKNIDNAVLVKSDIQMWDRGVYTCVGQPPYGYKTVNDTCMVRVKDKYAALWPFLGICAEVFVLCAIILIYEKKRNKTELEESDTDQSPDQKNTPDHNKDSNLRHRQ
ncbi:neuroplastin isoform X1 [Coccinella septempunctata]|uniref:neuroplastin isoform X1 n=2 Tax=Coccinella septempunctata TaxID=41139 RepID=UPI001D06B098|nr:neuroplastin isoform X1 [Coccinella septempunctata]